MDARLRGQRVSRGTRRCLFGWLGGVQARRFIAATVHVVARAVTTRAARVRGGGLHARTDVPNEQPDAGRSPR